MELNRSKIVDENFKRRVLANDFPIPHSQTTPEQAGLDKNTYFELFDSQLVSRHLDLLARILREQQQGFYTIGSAGHEGNAAIAKAFRKTDISFLHYRSGAFVIQRAKYEPQIDMMYDQVLSLVASSEDPISGGRHKVLGSVPLYIPPQTSTIASHLPKALGCALSITLAKALKRDETQSTLPNDSVVLCSFGDASFNHSTAQGALNAATWIQQAQLPLSLLWICEDNGIGISVPTPAQWIQDKVSHQDIHYIACDGRNIADVYLAAKQAEVLARKKGQVVFLHFKTVRLLGHAGSDIEFQYHTLVEIEKAESDDPLLHTARVIIENQWLTPLEVIEAYENVRKALAERANLALKRPKLASKEAVMASIVPPKQNMNEFLSKDYIPPTSLLNMAQAINAALAEILLQYPQTLVFGEDVAKKGGVYHVTADLQARFGKIRVFDTLLDEQTILGCAIGLAHNGFIPIPEIQFLAYTHNAADQIRGEAATLSFFSNGQYTNPMVIRIAGLAYQKGFGGHFHNDNAIGFLREIPGLIIACPSTAKDAALMLKQCVKLAQAEQRVVVFLEPIALYMLKDYHAKGDNLALCHYPKQEEIFFGEIGLEGDIKSKRAIISYGNGMLLARQAAHILERNYQMTIKLIDCRWLAPLPVAALQTALSEIEEIIIVDECRQTGSLSEQLVTWIVENISPLPAIKRICAQDTFIPIGNAWQTILPNCQDIVETVLQLDSMKRSF
ncbi:thiamine pyrophosphate-dependent enzyme [Candidatus Berkiella aquae]|uniref:3-methyl-2-oxobutanoate dehydrogenase (2-methylpropanoyl-transferring) n=1 Tax=Candidatus Berkiella aquae TaxID=295108 RepID=A0A0Q9YTZ5_9GAMM|nr:thiamine pyrophosphate-dependent enzyme [Candidatus Berkiella aquae]MCS5710122.1 MFS transporter [Candidatus Berkiella aquae]